MENEELKNKLIEKLEREVNEFKDTLRGLSADEIMDNSYKLTCIIEMKDYLIYNKELSKFELKTLLKREHILQECYDDWLSNDGSLREALEFSIDDTIDLIRENEVKKERNKDARQRKRRSKIMTKFVPKEVVKQAKEIDLLTYFMNNNPSELVRKGTNTYSLKSHDSVIISNGLWHRFSTHQAGKSAVDYLIKVENMTLQEAVSSVLNRNIDTYIRPQYSNENAPKTIVIPEKASTNKQVIEYLKNRGIDEEIINDCINKKIIYQENKTNNAVFLGYDTDNNIKYAGCRSTNEKRIMRDAKGSSKEYSFRMLGAEECNSLHIFESSIDLLSYATLLKNKGYDYTNQNLLSLAGVYQPSSNIEQSKVPIAVQNFLNKNTNIKDIVLHFDNDIAGRNVTKEMIYELDKYNVYDIPAPYGKDINDYLCYSIGLKNRQEIDRYKMKKEQNRVPM